VLLLFGVPSSGVPPVFEVVAAELAELTGVPPPAIAEPGIIGMEGSIMPINVTTDGLGLL